MKKALGRSVPLLISQAHLKWCGLLNIFVLLSNILSVRCQDSKGMCLSKKSDDIDEFIQNLNYCNDEVLAYNGVREDCLINYQGKLDNKKNFIVVSRFKRSLKNMKSDTGVVASNEHQSFPGALLLANQHLIDNSPDVLAAERAPITYTINLPGMTSADGTFTIVPSFNEFRSSTNKVLEAWFDKYPKDHNIIANFQTDQSFAYSHELLRVKFGVAFKNSIMETSINFDAVKKQEKLIMVYKFKQIFYTISVEATKNPSDLFGCEVTLKDLQKKINDKNPPVIVDSVSYGRTVYVILETSSTDKKAKALLENKLTQFFVDNKDEINYKKVLKDLSMQVYVIGGSSDSIALINARSLTEVNEVIVKHGKFSRNNLGFPLSYTTQFIKDNSRAVINMATDYIETTRTIYKKGIISLIHYGLFVVEWNVTWKEISYDEKGNEIQKGNGWNRNGKRLTAPFEEEIELSGNTRSIHVICKYVTGLPWQWWRVLINRSGITLIDRREFKISGTTMAPEHSITPELENEDYS